MATLVIGIGKGKPTGKGDKSEPMGDEPESAKEMGDEIDAALADAFQAARDGNKEAFKDAMRAAITSCCSDMLSEGKGEDY